MNRKNKTIWLILAAALLVALNMPEALSERGKSAIREFLAPLQQLVSGVGQASRNWVMAVRNLGEMAADNRRMATELTRLRSEMRYLAALEQENIALRSQLRFWSRAERELIPAEVIGREISGWWQVVRIGQGLAAGVEADMAVVTPDGLVGHTLNVSTGTADVRLLADPACKVAAWLPRADAHGVVAGRGLSARGLPLLHMRFINKDRTIRPGDEVTTSGLGGTYPPGLLIGHVEAVTVDESGLYQSAEIAPAADIGRMTFCFVVAEHRDPVETLLRERVRRGGPTP